MKITKRRGRLAAAGASLTLACGLALAAAPSASADSFLDAPMFGTQPPAGSWWDMKCVYGSSSHYVLMRTKGTLTAFTDGWMIRLKGFQVFNRLGTGSNTFIGLYDQHIEEGEDTTDGNTNTRDWSLGSGNQENEFDGGKSLPWWFDTNAEPSDSPGWNYHNSEQGWYAKVNPGHYQKIYWKIYYRLPSGSLSSCTLTPTPFNRVTPV